MFFETSILSGFWEGFGRGWEPFGRSRGLLKLFFKLFWHIFGFSGYCFECFWVIFGHFCCFWLFLAVGGCFKFVEFCWDLMGFANCYCVGRAKRASKASERSSLVLALGFPCLPMLSLAYPCFLLRRLLDNGLLAVSSFSCFTLRHMLQQP